VEDSRRIGMILRLALTVGRSGLAGDIRAGTFGA